MSPVRKLSGISDLKFMKKISNGMRDELKAALKKATGIDDPQVEVPTNEKFGDYSSNSALILAKEKKQNPQEAAQKIVKKLGSVENIEKIEVAGNGFINFWLSKDYLLENLSEISRKREHVKQSKVVVEYSSPNIAKPFTIGHLRSTIIGDAIANLLEATGHEVIRDNHLGDWGTQFGKQIYAIKTWGDEKEIEKAENPVKELVALYVRFHEEAEKDASLEDEARVWFKKLEDGDPEAKILWEKCVKWSLKEFQKIYQSLNVSFDTEYGESFFENKMDDVIKELKEKKLLKKSDGAELVFFEKDKYPPLMILKSDRATLYATRDLATDKFRLEKYGKDTVIINEVGSEQSLYFKQLFEVEKMLGWVKEGQRIHISHGLYRFKDEKMSTRKGNTIWLEDLLNMAFDKANHIAMQGRIDEHIVGGASVRKSITRQVAIGAMKWNDLKRNHTQDIIFDWDQVLNLEGDSGPYIQYAYVRTQSVLEKAKGKNSKNADLNEEEISILRALNKFPEIVEDAAADFEPNILTSYLFDLAQRFNLFYQKHRISENEFRLKLSSKVGETLKNGLNLLGIEAPSRM